MARRSVGRFWFNSASSHRGRSGFAVCFDIDRRAAVFAVAGVTIVQGQSTGIAFLFDLVRAVDGLQQLKEKTNAEDHDSDGQNATQPVRQDDIPVSGGRQRGDREIKRVDVSARA